MRSTPKSLQGSAIPSLEGGQPVRADSLPFCLPSIGREEIDAVVGALKSGWLTLGPRVKEFERCFAQYVSAKHAVAVNSCTAALHLALVAVGIDSGDEVITTPYTFAATGEVILYMGATPVFVDIDKKTYNIDVTKIEEKLTSRTKAIIPVHIAGQPCEMDELVALAKKHNLQIIEDAAHAIGAEYKGRKIGSIGNLTCFSFYATKNITTGEGGMITTDEDEYSENARILSLHGISKDAWKRYTSAGSWYYEILLAGYKYNMTDLQASLGIHQLRKLEQFLKRRQEIAAAYDEAFIDLPEITIPHVANDIRHAWHLYLIQLNLERLSIQLQLRSLTASLLKIVSH